MKYFYGGAFDPFTRSHLDIIKTINKQLSTNDELFVMVSGNDEKNYHTSVEDRFDIVTNVLNEKLKTNVPTILKQDKRTYAFLGEHFKNDMSNITICMGEDEWNSLCAGKWVNYDLLLKNYKFLVVQRNGNEKCFDENGVIHNMPKGFTPDVKFITTEISEGISSSAVREILFFNPDCHYEDVSKFITHQTFRMIKEKELYYQNSFDYAKKEEEFIKKYQIEKVERGYAEPSVTADVVAYNGNKILLIRRGNYPYKNYWCTVGGFFDKTDINLEHTAAREFEEETTIKYDADKFHQIKVYSHIFDPRLRIIDVAFEVRISSKDMNKAFGSDDAAEARWFDLDNLPKLGFHHEQIINDWKAKHRNEDYL